MNLFCLIFLIYHINYTNLFLIIGTNKMESIDIQNHQFYDAMSKIRYKTWDGNKTETCIFQISPPIFTKVMEFCKLLLSEGREDWTNHIVNNTDCYDDYLVFLPQPQIYSNSISEKLKEIVFKCFDTGDIKECGFVVGLLTGRNFNYINTCCRPDIFNDSSYVVSDLICNGISDFIEELIEKYPENIDLNFVFTLYCLYDGDKAKEMYQKFDNLVVDDCLFDSDCGDMSLDTFKWLMEIEKNRMYNILYTYGHIISFDGRIDILDYIVKNFPELAKNEDMESLFLDLCKDFEIYNTEEEKNKRHKTIQYYTNTFSSCYAEFMDGHLIKFYIKDIYIQQLDLIKDDYEKVLDTFGIKTEQRTLEYKTCIICHKEHNNIMITPCCHQPICLKSVLKAHSYTNFVGKCVYCTQNYDIKDFINIIL